MSKDEGRRDEAYRLHDDELEGVVGGTLPPELMTYFGMLDKKTQKHALQFLDGESEQVSVGYLITSLQEAGLGTAATEVESYYHSHYDSFG